MYKIEHNGHSILLYDSPENLPIRRYQRFNKFIMVDNEVGAGFADFSRRHEQVLKFLKAGLNENAIKELENWRISVFNSFNEYYPKGSALAVMVHSIDGIEKKDISNEGLAATLELISGLSWKKVEEAVNAVKKK